MAPTVDERQYYGYDDNYYWWDTPTVIIIKWIALAAILLVIFVFFMGGYLHAKRRMSKGLRPLAYHRWLVPHHRRAQFEPQPNPNQQQFSFYQAGNDYNMHPVPPPAYNPNFAPPPSYQPPAGASKAAPDQAYPMGTTEHGEPSSAVHQTDLTRPTATGGAASVQPESTGSTNPYK